MDERKLTYAASWDALVPSRALLPLTSKAP
jgi:hypothetical protein